MGKQTKFDLNSDEILARLRQHLNEQRPVTLYNTYQGVPITYEAEVAMIHSDFIGLIVHPYQAVCIKHERRTYLESGLLPALIRAYPVSIDFINHVVVLKRLKVPKSISSDLYHSWVAPEKPIKVKIVSENGDERSADLMEIAALDENQIRVVMGVPESSPYSRHANVGLTFRCVPDGNPVQVQGVVHSLVKVRNQALKRMEVAGNAVMREEITILAYIAKREDQIIKSLDKVYKKLRKGKKRPAK